MAELSGRSDYEMELARKLARLMQQQGRRLFDALGNPPDVNNLPPDVWDQLRQETGAVVMPAMESIYLAMAEQELAALPIGIDWGLVNEAAAQWAETHTSQLLAGINETTQRAIQRKIAAHFREGTPLSELRKSLISVLGPTRAELIAVTEVTRAASQAQMNLLDELRKQGARMRAIWNTANDELVCPICNPLNQTAQGVDWNDPPPAHGRCRCWVTLEFEE